ncbi:girdin-like [Cucumis melo var. makuwa]|uniref:Girdin-like n=1 Tax=Cucumis melo var. makuwa TaxID=1194695 RepID=A0A5A7UL51_CUCMM|nr:girdin-like [Cucumis melo var. makuwa]
MSNISMHSSFESKFDEPSDVLKWAEEMQQKFGDGINNSSKISVLSRCQLSSTQNDLANLKMIWEALTPQRRFMFSKKYGHIAELMYILVNYFALRAIINFWDPAYGCFTFGSCDLLPTIEEYQAMLSMPEKEREIVYFFNPKQTTKTTTEIQKYIKVKGGEENVPFDYLIKMTQTYIDEDKGLTLLALCIYGAVIFPKAEGYVDGKVIKLFFEMERGVNPIIPILAKTFRSLNYCRNKGEGKFNCCVPLLYIWIQSHIKFSAEFRCPRLDFSSPWNLMRNTISEFCMTVWDPTYPRKEAWLSFFAKLTSENVIWKAQWMPLKAAIYRCEDFHSVPLLGPWGGVNYTPLLVLRQVWLKQFIPPTQNLQESDFSYNPEDCQGKKRQAVCAWKSIRKIKDKGHCEGVTSGYEAWKANKRKNIIDISREVVERGKETSFAQPNQWIEKSIELEEKNRLLEQENEKLRKETSQWMDHATYLQNELEKTKSIEHLEAQAKIQDIGQNENTLAKQKLDVLEERLRAIEETDVYGNTDATQLCLVPSLIIPAKFKVPEFDKYDGSTCPRTHLIMYCRKMAAHINNDKLLVHCFQDSLTGPASRWYIQLDNAHIHVWKDLADAFLKQYIDMAPDRLDLQRMEKKSSESFKEYA